MCIRDRFSRRLKTVFILFNFVSISSQRTLKQTEQCSHLPDTNRKQNSNKCCQCHHFFFFAHRVISSVRIRKFTKCETTVLTANRNKALNAVRRRHGPVDRSDRAGREPPQWQTSLSLPANISKTKSTTHH